MLCPRLAARCVLLKLNNGQRKGKSLARKCQIRRSECFYSTEFINECSSRALIQFSRAPGVLVFMDFKYSGLGTHLDFLCVLPDLCGGEARLGS